ncbi:MAG: sialate O-acetylesterase, partial [Thermoguttaceae bacterium]
MKLKNLALVVAFCAAVTLSLASAAKADVKVSPIISDNMVLQRGQADTLWGWAEPGEEVTATINGQTKTTKADAEGKWSLKLDPMRVGGPFELKIKGKNELNFKNVMVGDVWVCSGQSNMQWSVNASNNPEEEIKNANHPKIRLITVPLASSSSPKDTFEGTWTVCSPETIPHFTAVGYFFGRELQKADPEVPIGLINCSWGGSSCETWINPEVVAQYADYAQIMERKANAEVQNPQGGDNQQAGYLYNAMVLPIIKYGIKGAIWYQGETNAGRAYQYRTLFPLMIQNWREEWGQGDFPFYFVQLANFMDEKDEPGESAWAELREAQSMTRNLRNTGEAVIIDIGDAKDIHPRNKQDVGKRLALLSQAADARAAFGRGQRPAGQGQGRGVMTISEGPRFQSMKIEGDKAVITYNFGTSRGLKAKDGQLKGFAIAGADKKFYWADAKIEGNTVVVSSSQVPNPVAVRYAWADNPSCNLYNEADLPAAPFRTDMWPGVT